MSKRNSCDSLFPGGPRQRAMSPHRPPSRMSDCWHGHSCRKPGCLFTHPQDLKKNLTSRTRHDHNIDDDPYHSSRSDGDPRAKNTIVDGHPKQRATYAPMLSSRDRTVDAGHEGERNQKDDTPTIPTQPRSSRDPRPQARLEGKALVCATGSLSVNKAIPPTKPDKMDVDGPVPKPKTNQKKHLQDAREKYSTLQSNDVVAEERQIPGVDKQPAAKKQEDSTNLPRSSPPLSTPLDPQIAAIQDFIVPDPTSSQRTGAETMFITRNLTIAIDLRIRISGLEKEKRSIQAKLQKYKDTDKEETSRLKHDYDSEIAKLEFTHTELARLNKRSEKNLAELARYISVAPHLSDIVTNYGKDNAALRRENALLRTCINSNGHLAQHRSHPQQFEDSSYYSPQMLEHGKAWEDIISRIFELEGVLGNITGPKTKTVGGSDVKSFDRLDLKLQRLERLVQAQRASMNQDLVAFGRELFDMSNNVITPNHHQTGMATIAKDTLARFNDLDTKIIHELGHIASNIKDVGCQHIGLAQPSPELWNAFVRRNNHMCRLHEEFIDNIQLRLATMAILYPLLASARNSNEYLQRQSSSAVPPTATNQARTAASGIQCQGATVVRDPGAADVGSFAQQVTSMELQLQGLTQRFDDFATDQHVRAITNALRHLWPRPLATTRRLVAVEQQILDHEQRTLALSKRISSMVATETGFDVLDHIRATCNHMTDFVTYCKTLLEGLEEAVRAGRSHLESEKLDTCFENPEQDLHMALKEHVEMVEVTSEALSSSIQGIGGFIHKLEEIVQKIGAMPSGGILFARKDGAEVPSPPATVPPVLGFGSSMLRTRKPPTKKRKLNEDEEGADSASIGQL